MGQTALARPEDCALSPASVIGSEGEAAPDCWSKVVVGVIGDAGAMRNGDSQTAAHEGICNSGKRVETLGEVMVQVERPLVEATRAGSAEAG